MKIQHLAVIFIIIIMPISIVFAQYTQMQIDTILLEKEYDTRLLNCTYDAIKAYQLNTVNNSMSDVTNSKVADIEASVNAFKNSLVTAFGYSGYDSSVMDEYLPAIVYTLYDGYYIYSPYQNTLTETTVYNDSTYKDNDKINGLKTYVYYSCRYKKGTTYDFVITYTLDNSITIQGIVNGTYVNESGYLIDGITYNASRNSYTYDGIEFKESDYEYLEEYVGDTKYPYVKLNGTKYYLSGEEIFSIINGVKTTQTTKDIDPYSYKFYEDRIKENISAYTYYKEAYEFTMKIRNNWNLKDLNASHAVDMDGNPIDLDGDSVGDFGNYIIFQDNASSNTTGRVANGYIQDDDSNFNQMRRAVIRYSIETNLRTAIASFTKYSSVSTDFAMPKISESDWELIENNVTTISFLQGLSINSKKYNGYAVVPNTLTKEYVPEDSIYIETTDNQYHKSNDIDLINTYQVSKSSGFLNLDYERRYLTNDQLKDIYYYPRSNSTGDPKMGCYKSISGNSGVNYVSTDMYKYMRETLKVSNYTGTQKTRVQKLKTEYYRALARERQSSFKIYNDEIVDPVVLYGGIDGLGANINANGVPNYEIVKKYSNYKVTSCIPTTTYTDLITGQELAASFKGWTTNIKDLKTVQYPAGSTIYSLKNSITLYPVWDVDEYAIKYDANLSTGETVKDMPSPIYEKASIVSNIKITDAMPIKTSGDKEYICLGWSTTRNSHIVEYTSGDEFVFSGEFGTILYAVWGEYATINTFDWREDKSSSVTNTFDYSAGNSINIIGNKRNAGKSAVWTMLNDENYYYMQLTFGYSINFGDSFNAAGLLLGIKETTTHLNSYAISFNNTWKSTSENKNGGLWNARYKRSDNYSALTAYSKGTTIADNRAVLIQGLDIPNSGTMVVTIRNMSDGNKKVSIQVGTMKHDFTMSNGYSFGFFSSHYSHSCSQKGQFRLTNISMKVGENK